MIVTRPDPASAGPPRGESMEALFAALESPLLAYALRLLGIRTQAEDAVQDAFMKLHAQFDTVREPRKWLYRTVHNAALNHRRSAGRLQPLPDPAPGDGPATPETADPDPLPDEQIIRWEGIGLVRLSLASLDPRSREVVRLKFEENLSYREIGDRTGLTSGHVGYLLHHALKSLAGELAKAGLIP